MTAEPLERPDGEIDLVAEPVHYPRAPLLALLVIALVPTLALYGLFRWADDEADRYDATRADVEAIGGETGDDWFAPDLRGGVDADGDGVRDEPDDAPDEEGEHDAASDDGDDRDVEVTTALFDYRRAPDAVADIASASRLGAEVQPVFSFLGDSSCGAVAVGGVATASHRADEPVIPASNQKLLVAAVALQVLGPDHRFTTSVAVPRPVDGEVDGDIYLIGGGDPVLGSDDFPTDGDRFVPASTTSLDVLADAVVAAGVTRVRGTVIGDGTRYDDEFAVEDWADGIVGVDAGPYDALFVNDARVRGRSGREDDPNEAAAREFVRLLGNRGVRVDNGWGSGVASTLVPVVGTVESPPLSDIVGDMLLTSDNDTAELLLKEIGLVAGGEGTRRAGADAVVATLDGLGLPIDGLVVVDGSGLSTSNRVTCGLVLGVLQRFSGTALSEGLPIAGRTGTLADEFEDSPMVDRLRAKTGTLNNEPFDVDPPAVKALAGYVTTPGEDVIEFVLIVNGPDISLESRYRPLWDALGDRLDTFPSGPTAGELGPR